MSETVPSNSLYCLPIELRYQIYSLLWEPRTVFLNVGLRNRTQNLPVTLQLNHETRKETLKHYHGYSLWCDEPYYQESCGYINPYLDVVHLDYTRISCLSPETGLASPRFKFDIGPRITKPLLRVIIDPALTNPLDGLDILHKMFDMSCIRTIDFWVTTSRLCSLASRSLFLGNPDPKKISMTTSRYRICRAKAKKVPVVGWKEAVLQPQHLGNKCWSWEYRPEFSRPLTAMPLNIEDSINLRSPESWPVPETGAQLLAPCAVSNWDQVQPDAILRKDGALLFDAGSAATEMEPSISSDSPTAMTPSPNEEYEWQVLKVVDTKNIWERDLTALAFGHLFTFSPLDHGDVVARRNGLLDLRRVTSNPAPDTMVEWLQTIGSGWPLLPPALQERAMVIAEAVHGVCAPDYMYGNEDGNKDNDGKYGTPQDFIDVDKCCPQVSSPSIRELHCGRESVERGRDILFAEPSHQEVLNRRYRVASNGIGYYVYAA
ncbi:hypothetical protein B0T21DRAFT_414500 [Apiosordaria backusii]|uniref:2EXR domain-containing protein n=1 Tax=Apiosordaria backusii TaxID=314023 RepID=A0AA40ASQ0_9PEZI|nr:hypothetical protein B0T21DRAFT_414500 [Apiosordaria backusii]